MLCKLGSLIACVGLVALAGCGMTPAQMQSASTPGLALEYGQWGKADVEEELRSRGTFTEEQWARIKSRDVRVGDDVTLVYAAYGHPNSKRSGSIKLADGTRKWLGFDTGYPRFAPVVIYTENDRVVAIEE